MRTMNITILFSTMRTMNITILVSTMRTINITILLVEGEISILQYLLVQ